MGINIDKPHLNNNLITKLTQLFDDNLISNKINRDSYSNSRFWQING